MQAGRYIATFCQKLDICRHWRPTLLRTPGRREHAINLIAPVGFEEHLERLRRSDPALALSQVPSGITAFWGESLGRPHWMFAGTDLPPGQPLPREIRLIDDLQIMSNLLQMQGEVRLGAMMLEWSRYPNEAQILAAPDLGAALRFFVGAIDRKNRTVTTHMSRTQGLAIFGFEVDPVLGPLMGIHEQVLLLLMFLIIRSFLGINSQGVDQLSRVTISRLHSSDAVDGLLPCQLSRAGEGAFVAVPEELLNCPGLTFNPELWASIVGEPDTVAGAQGHPPSIWLDEIEHIVRSALENEARVPAFPEVAAGLGQAERTLARKFAACGHTYRGLIDKTRMAMAEELLLQDGVKVKDVGYQLGYSDCSAFVRSFRRYSGISPARWRKTKRANGWPTGG